MNYTEFTSKIENEVLNYIPNESGLKATINRITKNNGTIYDALTIVKPIEGISTAPAIYLNGFYQDYLKGTSFNDMLKEIASIYINNKDFSVSNLDFLESTENIIFNIINKKANEEILKTVPHLVFLDLAIIFRYVVNINEDGIGSVVINNSLTNLDAKELLKYALINNKRKFTYTIRTMEEIMSEIMGISFEPEEVSSIGMYVISNNIGINGSAVMAYPDVFKKLSDKLNADKLYILPSSIHELIAVPVIGADDFNIKELKDMVMSVNGSEVSPDEILSDNVYLYDRQTNSIQFAN